MAAQFTFEVYTPYRLFYSGMIEMVILTLSDGDAAICANHSHLTAPVTPCVLKIKDSNGIWKFAFIAEGILEVSSHKTVLISDTAEWPEEIDYERAMAAREKAEKTLATATLKFETETAAASLKRAAMRIRARDEGLKKNRE